jgi:PIN domain nuclease of toxin-antitoxin system
VRPPLLDTHTWIWYLGDQTKFTSAELNALDALDFENRPFISDFSLWEIATRTSIKRLMSRGVGFSGNRTRGATGYVSS